MQHESLYGERHGRALAALLDADVLAVAVLDDLAAHPNVGAPSSDDKFDWASEHAHEHQCAAAIT